MQKIAEQAARDVTLIRCPRDGVVMRILASRSTVASPDSLGEASRERGGEAAPLAELDVECPACRRRATGIRPRRRETGEAATARR